MSVNYKLIKNRMKSGEKTAYRAVTVEHKTVGVERIAQNIQGATALTRADVIATIAALRDEIAYAGQVYTAAGHKLKGYFVAQSCNGCYDVGTCKRRRSLNVLRNTLHANCFVFPLPFLLLYSWICITFVPNP